MELWLPHKAQMKPILNLFLFHSPDFYIRKKPGQRITYFVVMRISLIFLKACASTSIFLQKDSLPSEHPEAGSGEGNLPLGEGRMQPLKTHSALPGLWRTLEHKYSVWLEANKKEQLVPHL